MVCLSVLKNGVNLINSMSLTNNRCLVGLGQFIVTYCAQQLDFIDFKTLSHSQPLCHSEKLHCRPSSSF